ncbi:MAG: hypothetical protein ACJASV_002620 [Pseudorhodobacter sp.]|jgi:hypothetical protein
MRTSFRGTFVISWSQTETDGLRAAPIDVLAVGASWRWTGETVRVDGAQGLLLLEGAEGAADLRKRAARMVRRLIGTAICAGREEAVEDVDDFETQEQGFIVTDGHQSYSVTLIEVRDTGARLLMFVNDVPPKDVDLWVVRLSIDRSGHAAGARTAGGVICFTPGTVIRTEDGPRRIEDLRPGDWIQTKDNGMQEVLWSGHRRMTGARLHAMPHLRPIRFRAGAMGIGRPEDDLLVSPQHRMLVNGPAARALFNTDEVLVAAEDLLNGSSIAIDLTLREVTYIHILLERHQVIWANGLETESFHPSNTALDTVAPEQRAGLLSLLPGLAENPHVYGDYARRNLSGSEAAILRHDLAA